MRIRCKLGLHSFEHSFTWVNPGMVVRQITCTRCNKSEFDLLYFEEATAMLNMSRVPAAALDCNNIDGVLAALAEKFKQNAQTEKPKRGRKAKETVQASS